MAIVLRAAKLKETITAVTSIASAMLAAAIARAMIDRTSLRTRAGRAKEGGSSGGMPRRRPRQIASRCRYQAYATAKVAG
jgi:hypothetical protein